MVNEDNNYDSQMREDAYMKKEGTTNESVYDDFQMQGNFHTGRNVTVSEEFVNNFLMAHSNNLPSDKIYMLKERIRKLPKENADRLQFISLKNASTMILISIFLGQWGIDRFMLGETGLGILKFLTCGACGVWTVIDWFMISKKTKEYNFKLIMNALM
ncbi:TM2 domain-containing protein [Leptotrichia sp. OH3620_COT-345]|uniref:TM2 domain-containing protein n=1 Tax=Leptotrichia sp. OH3620_COT-345 TaxID=2491048 RepID=UPI0013158C00|nr:TM2 domain-containing protein [Leptotrichia sp. OH3620_COT-345]